MNKPKGFLGKDWDSMTKEEVLKAFFWVWGEKERIKKELISYEKVLTNKLK